jgi:alkylation response protein AidB-like acyl-CoA dehydrogenase
MRLELDDDQQQFRDGVREFLADSLPVHIKQRIAAGYPARKQDTVAWHRIVAQRGWAGVGWPREHGGTGWTPMQRMIFLEESMLASAPDLQGFNLYMIGPTLIAFGTPEQQYRLLPRILALDDWWCQGFSEPNAGSDLAALKTTAIRDGDHYVVNGSKLWTSLAHHADMMFCLVKTADGRRPQESISFLMIDMRTPGITIRPIRTIDGSHHVNEVFLDNVAVPVTMRLGEENAGWTYAKYLLSNERMAVAKVGRLRDRLNFAKQLARKAPYRGAPIINQPWLRRELARLEMEIKALEITQHRVVSSQDGRPTGQPDPASSILKLRASELLQGVLEVAVRIGGPKAVRHWDSYADQTGDFGADDLKYLSEPYLFARSATIYGGSTEIQKNIVAKSVLGFR